MKTSEAELDNFIEELNLGIEKVGEVSTLKAYKLHKFVSFTMVWVTIFGITFIVENKMYNMELPLYNGINVLYYIAIFLGLVIGYFGSNFAEEGKIEFIKGAIFSYGGNRMWQLLGIFGVIALLIFTNKTGVQDMANYGLRYMDSKIMQDEGIRLDLDVKEQREAVVSQNNALIKDLIDQKQDIKQATEDYVSRVDKRAYRTMILNKRKEARAEMAKLDWKIKQIQATSNDTLNTNQANITSLKSKILAKKEENAEFVNDMKNIGIYVAIWGEVIDAFFIMLFLWLHKTNPNIQGSPTIQRHRKSIKQSVGKPKGSLNAPSKNNNIHFVNNRKIPNKIIDSEIEYIIDNLIDKDDVIELEGTSFVSQPRQRNIMKSFYDRYEKVLRPERLTKYNRKKVKEGVLQKVGKQYVFVEDRELAA